MATVRISSDWGHPQHMDWCGAPTVDMHDHIDRSINIPEDAFRRIEAGIAQGYIEGVVFLDDGSRFEWFLDRSPRESPHQARRIAPTSPSEPRTKDTSVESPVRFCPHCGAPLQFPGAPEKTAAPEPPTSKSGGWVIGEFPVAKSSDEKKCPSCSTMIDTNPNPTSQS